MPCTSVDGVVSGTLLYTSEYLRVFFTGVYWQHWLSARNVCCGSIVRYDLLGHSLLALYVTVVIAHKITDERSAIGVLVILEKRIKSF